MPADLFADNDLNNPASDVAGSRQHYCPSCRKPLRRIDGRRGPFWGCTGYPECSTSLFDNDGKPSDEPDERYRCPVCTRSMIKASNNKGHYWYCTGYNRGCKVTLTDVDGKPESAFRCRLCGHLLRIRSSKNGKFWGCTQYPECHQTYRDQNGEPDFP